MTTLTRATIGVLVVLATVRAAPQSATASIAGVVVSDAGQPVRGVTLTLSSSALSAPRLTISGDDGRFVFDGVAASTYTLTALRPGYVTTSYGATRSWRSPGIPIPVNAGERVTLQPLKLMRGAVVTGRVTDSNGQPLESLSVAIHELRTLNGQMTLSSVPGIGSAGTTTTSSTVLTDDRGMFRIFGLPAGTFVISTRRNSMDPLRAYETTTAADLQWAASLSPTGTTPAPPERGPSGGYVPVYFPGTTDASTATPVTVTAGEERDGVNITMESVRFAKVSGVVSVPSGQSPAGISLTARHAGDIAGAASTAAIPPIANANAQGEFTLANVPPGGYTVIARRTGAQNQALFGQAEISVNGFDVSGVSVQMLPGVTVSGRVVFENRDAPFSDDLLRAGVRLAQLPAMPSAALPLSTIQPDGSFRLNGVPPGAYTVGATLPGPDGSWMVTSATAGTQDLMATTLTVQPGTPVTDIAINLSDRVTEISGMLRDPQGRPSPDFYVLAYPADRRLWAMGRERLRPAVRPDASGRYRIAGLAPGEYYLAAITVMQPNDFADPAFLEVIVPASLKLTITAGEKKVQDVTLASQ